jgi:flagellar motility protein MotE (MotC chaperone)
MKSKTLAYSFIAFIYISSGSQSEEPTLPVASMAPSAAEDLCEAFADKAAEAKLARQRKELLEVKATIEKQLVVLDEKTKQLESWVTKRNEIRESVSTSLVKMYSNVESETAAQQLQKLNPQSAAEILQRLKPKQSGEIVTAMDVDFASKVMKIMMADVPKQKEKMETQ